MSPFIGRSGPDRDGLTPVDSLMEAEEGRRTNLDVLPIFLCEKRRKPESLRIVAFTGSGFRFGARPDVLVTCWHCVSSEPEGQIFAVAVELATGTYGVHPLVDLEQDANGSDLAVARIHGIDIEPQLNFTLAPRVVPGGTDVWTWGYPLTEKTRDPSGGNRFTLHGRYLQGYTTRAFWYEHHLYGRTPSYELDMPLPEGLSGAPLVKLPGPEVVGVVFGQHDVARIEESASLDPNTGERNTEVQRIVSFGLAHYTSTLANLTGAPTSGARLADYLSEVPS